MLVVDDFAIRRGQTCSTVLTSVEGRHVVDVLPTREAGPLAACAEGARRGAPDAPQVADRFHLWRPKAVRAEQWWPRWQYPVLKVRGVSARTRAAIRQVEDEEMWPNAVAHALSRFEWAFRQPGRYPNASEVCSPGIEVEDAGDDLEQAMLHLPSGARRDLGRLITRIDEEFDCRALPVPPRNRTIPSPSAIAPRCPGDTEAVMVELSRAGSSALDTA
ncbi:hypothetical protein ACGF5O_08095 [Streptomyces sp. NPDC048291]|uniref:hypothetical protein n=1 Tax=Streptomyces sp. NPDC048291 TaxID=3365530 RepID=UPI0037105A6F